jgi:hypothetical protein
MGNKFRFLQDLLQTSGHRSEQSALSGAALVIFLYLRNQ